MSFPTAESNRRITLRKPARKLALALLAAIVAPLASAAADDPLDEADDAQVAVPVDSVSKSTASSGVPAVQGATPADRAQSPLISDQSVVWAIPPIPWRANLMLSLDGTADTQQNRWNSATTALSAAASTYVIAPWFLRLSGATNFSESRSPSEGTGSEAISANLGGNLLDRTRYPANFSLGGARTSVIANGGGYDTTFRNLAWAQQFSPADQSLQSNLQYTWSNFSGYRTSGVTSQALFGSASFRVPGELPQTLVLNGSVQNTEEESTGRGSSERNLILNHSVFLEDYVMTLTSDASVNRSLAVGADERDAMFTLVGTAMDWIPSDDYPLRLAGQARYQVLRDLSPSRRSAGDSRFSTLRMDATYPHSKNWSFSGNSLFLRTQLPGADATTYSVGGGAGWSGDGFSTKLDEWAYTLGYGSGLSFSQLGTRVNQEVRSLFGGVFTAGLSQGLNRVFSDDPRTGRSAIQLSESLDGYKPIGADTLDPSAGLQHGVVYSWNRPPSRDSSMVASLAGRDGRSFGSGDTNYQELSASVNGIDRLNAREQFTWNGSAQLTRQSSRKFENAAGSANGAGGWLGLINLGIGYSNLRFANTPGLTYNAAFNAYMRPNSSTGLSNLQGGFATDQSFLQSWSWRLGLLAWSFGNDIRRSDAGVMIVGVRLMVSRDFGGVL